MTAQRAHQPSLVATTDGEERHRDVVPKEESEGWSGDGDVAEDEDLVDVDGGDGSEFLAALLHDEAALPVAQSGALRRDIERWHRVLLP